MRQIPFTEIGGIRVGHAQNLKAATGATIIIEPLCGLICFADLDRLRSLPVASRS